MQTQDAIARELMTLEVLEAEITQLAGNLAAAECRWLSKASSVSRLRWAPSSRRPLPLPGSAFRRNRRPNTVPRNPRVRSRPRTVTG
jgi:hypothetical protein